MRDTNIDPPAPAGRGNRADALRLALAALCLTLLAAAYVALGALAVVATIRHARENTWLIDEKAFGMFAYLAGLLAGGALLAFLGKPLVAWRRRPRDEAGAATEILVSDASELHALAAEAARTVGAEVPHAIDCDASGGVLAKKEGTPGRRGARLRIGLPLVALASRRDLLVLVAFALAPFRRGLRPGLERGIRAIEGVFSAAVAAPPRSPMPFSGDGGFIFEFARLVALVVSAGGRLVLRPFAGIARSIAAGVDARANAEVSRVVERVASPAAVVEALGRAGVAREAVSAAEVAELAVARDGFSSEDFVALAARLVDDRTERPAGSADLFADFAAACAAVCAARRRRGAVASERAASADEIVARVEESARDAAALERFRGDVPPGPASAPIDDDDASRTPPRERLLEARSRMAATHAAAARDARAIAAAREHEIAAAVLRARLSGGAGPRARLGTCRDAVLGRTVVHRDSEHPRPTLESATASIHAAREEAAALRLGPLESFEAAAAARIEAALEAAPPEVDPAPFHEALAALDAIEEARLDVERHRAELEALLAARAKRKGNPLPRLEAAILLAATRLVDRLDEIRARLARTPHPFSPEGSTRSLADALFPNVAPNAPAAEVAASLTREIHALRRRASSRLASLALDAEAALGLEPVEFRRGENPPDPTAISSTSSLLGPEPRREARARAEAAAVEAEIESAIGPAEILKGRSTIQALRFLCVLVGPILVITALTLHFDPPPGEDRRVAALLCAIAGSTFTIGYFLLKRRPFVASAAIAVVTAATLAVVVALTDFEPRKLALFIVPAILVAATVSLRGVDRRKRSHPDLWAATLPGRRSVRSRDAAPEPAASDGRRRLRRSRLLHFAAMMAVVSVLIAARYVWPPFDSRVEEFRAAWNEANFRRVDALVHSAGRRDLRDATAGWEDDWPALAAGEADAATADAERRRVEFLFADGSARLVTIWSLESGNWSVRSLAIER